jgi:hypothetical protein
VASLTGTAGEGPGRTMVMAASIPENLQRLGALLGDGTLRVPVAATYELAQAPEALSLLNPLEADGLVARERDPADRHRHLVTLTPAGERQLADASTAQKQAEDELFASLDDQQREQLRALLIALRDGLAADPEAACTAAEEAGR